MDPGLHETTLQILDLPFFHRFISFQNATLGESRPPCCGGFSIAFLGFLEHNPGRLRLFLHSQVLLPRVRIRIRLTFTPFFPRGALGRFDRLYKTIRFATHR